MMVRMHPRPDSGCVRSICIRPLYESLGSSFTLLKGVVSADYRRQDGQGVGHKVKGSCECEYDELAQKTRRNAKVKGRSLFDNNDNGTTTAGYEYAAFSSIQGLSICVETRWVDVA
jgi:hypothetical protein